LKRDNSDRILHHLYRHPRGGDVDRGSGMILKNILENFSAF
jgi:hypothetical protein